MRGGRRGCKALHAPEAEALERHLFDRSASKESEEWAVQERYRTLLADASLLFISAIWGLGFAAMKGALESFPPFWLLTIRFAAAALLIALIFWRRMRRIAWEDLRGGMIIGVFLFLGFATQTVGLLYTTASKQAFLTAVYVVLVPFFAWGVKRVFPGLRPFGASALCLLGMAFLTLDLKGDFVINYGDVLTLICAIFFAGHLRLGALQPRSRRQSIARAYCYCVSVVEIAVAWGSRRSTRPTLSRPSATEDCCAGLMRRIATT